MKRLLALALLCLAAGTPATVIKSGQTVSGTTSTGATTAITSSATRNGVFVLDPKGVTNATLSGYSVNTAYRVVETPIGSVTNNLVISNLSGTNLYRGLIRIRDGNNITISNVRARFKAAPATSMKEMPTGISFTQTADGKLNNVTIDGFDCDGPRMQLSAKEYWNGDCIDEDAVGTGFKLLNITANNATDGGMDVKAIDPVIDNFHGTGDKRDLRLWHGCECGTITVGQPVFPGGIGGAAGVWMKGGTNSGVVHIRRLVVRYTSPRYPILAFDAPQALVIDSCDIQAPVGTPLMKGPHGKQVTLGTGCSAP